jgi:hypothetical protein
MTQLHIPGNTSTPEGINVKAFGAKGDGVTDDTQSIINAFNAAKSAGAPLYFPQSSGTYHITQPLTFDAGGNPLFVRMDGQIQPSAGIGTALTIKNVRGGDFTLRVYGGGSSSDVAFAINNVQHCTFEVYGRYFAGTVWNVTGHPSTNDECNTCTVKVLSTKTCGRALIHGPSTAINGIIINGFGAYIDVWDDNSANGSIFQNCGDVTIVHFENYFNNPSDTALTFNNCDGIHMGMILLGGRANWMMTIEGGLLNGTYNIEKLYLLGQDQVIANVTPPTTNGLLVAGPADPIVTITMADIRNMNYAYEYTTSASVTILDFNPSGNTNTVVNNGTILGYPNNSKGIYAINPINVYEGLRFFPVQNFNNGLNLANVNNGHLVFLGVNTSDVFQWFISNASGSNQPYFTLDITDVNNRLTRPSGSMLSYTKYTQAETVQTVGASPYTLQNTNDYPCAVIVQGGTVSEVDWIRGSNTRNTGATQGMFYLAPNDSIKITYTVAPTVVLIPL